MEYYADEIKDALKAATNIKLITGLYIPTEQ